MALEFENQVFHSNLMELLGPGDVNEGKYAVIKGEHMGGPFDDYEEALKYGYNTHGVTPFLVKKIERTETVFHFSRDLR